MSTVSWLLKSGVEVNIHAFQNSQLRIFAPEKINKITSPIDGHVDNRNNVWREWNRILGQSVHCRSTRVETVELDWRNIPECWRKYTHFLRMPRHEYVHWGLRNVKFMTRSEVRIHVPFCGTVCALRWASSFPSLSPLSMCIRQKRQRARV
jgi:hypothetical protein